MLTEADLSRADLQEFDCGSLPWEAKVGTFLRGGEAWAEQQAKRNRTYLYRAEAGQGEVLGFATVSRRSIDPPPQPREAGRIRTLLICWFAVDRQYWGHREGGSYAEQMVAALANMALDAGLSGFTAFVDERNERALRFWMRMGFRSYAHLPPFVDEADHSTNLFLALLFPSDDDRRATTSSAQPS